MKVPMLDLKAQHHTIRAGCQQLVLLGHQHGHSMGFKVQQRVPYGFHQHRGNTFAGFVEQQKTRAGHQRAGNRQHLLLATTHLAGQPAQHGLAPWTNC